MVTSNGSTEYLDVISNLVSAIKQIERLAGVPDCLSVIKSQKQRRIERYNAGCNNNGNIDTTPDKMLK